MTKRMTKKYVPMAERAALLPEPNDDPAAAGFAAAKLDNCEQGRIRDRRAAEDRGERIAKKIHEGNGAFARPAIPLTSRELDDLNAYLRCGR